MKICLPVDMGDHWQREYEIGWPECARRSADFGVDSIQSLLIALQKVEAEIYTGEDISPGNYRGWSGAMVMAFRCLQGFDIFMKVMTGILVINAFLELQAPPQAP